MTHSRNDNDKTYVPREQNPADTGDGRVDPDNNRARTRIRGDTKPLDLWLPEGTGTVTREEYYEARDGLKPMVQNRDRAARASDE